MSVDVGTVIVGGVGLLLGYLIRLHEVIRSERKSTYLGYLRALDRLPHAIMEAALADSADEPMDYAEDAARLIAEAEADMSLTASPRVTKKVASLRESLRGPEMLGVVQGVLSGIGRMNPDERDRRQLAFLEQYWELVAGKRVRLVNAMRWDLRVRRLGSDVSSTSTWV